jgi:hypothetical protein
VTREKQRPPRDPCRLAARKEVDLSTHSKMVEAFATYTSPENHGALGRKAGCFSHVDGSESLFVLCCGELAQSLC